VSAVHGLLSKICLSRHHVIIFGATQAKKKKKRKENDSLNYIIIFYEDIPEPKFVFEQSDHWHLSLLVGYHGMHLSKVSRM
jgi:hypothetical protein